MTNKVNKNNRNNKKRKKEKRKLKWNIPASVITVLVAMVFAYCISYGYHHGPVLLAPSGDPGETVLSYMNQMIAENREALTGESGTSFGTLLTGSISYETVGTCQVSELTASQNVIVRYADLSKLSERLGEVTQENLETMVQERDKEAVYDENKNYLPEIIEEAYALSVKSVCEESLTEELFGETVIPISLSYEDGVWKVTDAPGLKKALMGETSAGTANDFASYLLDIKGASLGDLAYVRKIYTIPEHDMSPTENQACYGETTNPEDITAVLEMAEELLEGQEVIWDPTVTFAPRSVIKYYYDETLLVICWKEIIEGKCCAMAEIKIADGSQLRRTIAGGEYGSSIQLLPTTMAEQSNAVLALSGDFYAFRPLGITVYDREVHRFAPQSIDTCYFTASGDMMFTYAGTPDTIEEAQAFVDENDITFAVAFGPILVDHGELREIKSYPIGEVNESYSRTTFAQKGNLHYVLMCINYEGVTRAATIQESARFIYEKGVDMAYALDGGQTSTMIINDTLYNCVDWNAERMMSDIIYFSTALPEDTWNQTE